jgi:coatomer protein complex subunit epsilon
MTVSDSLLNTFYSGAYSQISTPRTLEEKVLFYRAQLALGNITFVAQQQDEQVELFAFTLLARYWLHSCYESDLVEFFNTSTNNPHVMIAAGIFYCHQKQYTEALQCVELLNNLECMALSIQIHIVMNRLDSAEKVLQAVKSSYAESLLSQMMEAWVDLAKGEGANEAYYIFQELNATGFSTETCSVGQAIAKMSSLAFGEASQLLTEAYNRNPKHADVLANLIVCGIHMDQPSHLLDQYRKYVIY